MDLQAFKQVCNTSLRLNPGNAPVTFFEFMGAQHQKTQAGAIHEC
jgi:hypothetical protein